MHPLDILYWSALMLGGGYIGITLALGGLSDLAGALHHGDPGAVGIDVDSGAHAGDLGVDSAGHVDAGVDASAESGHAGLDHAGHQHDVHHHSVLSFVSPLTIASFLLGGGLTGVVSRLIGTPILPSAAYAAVGGVATWGTAYLVITQLFGKAQATSHNLREELVGLRAQVTAPIEGDRPGMVSYVVGGTRQSLPAVSDEEEILTIGSSVRIRQIRGNTAFVRRVD